MLSVVGIEPKNPAASDAPIQSTKIPSVRMFICLKRSMSGREVFVNKNLGSPEGDPFLVQYFSSLFLQDLQAVVEMSTDAHCTGGVHILLRVVKKQDFLRS